MRVKGIDTGQVFSTGLGTQKALSERVALTYMGFPGGSTVRNLPANEGDAGSIAGSGRSPGERDRNLLQYAGLENPVDRGACQATVNRDAESNMTEAPEHTHIDTYTQPCVKHLAPGKQLYSTWSSILLCDDLEVWDGGSDRKEAHDGGDICIPIADSCCHTADTNTTL